MIKNFLCEVCVHGNLCKFRDCIEKFGEDAKKPMGIDIEILKCASYEKDE